MNTGIGGKLRFLEGLADLTPLADRFQLGYLLSGETTVTAAGESRLLRAGDLFVRNPGEDWRCAGTREVAALLLEIPETEFAAAFPGRRLRFQVVSERKKIGDTVGMLLRELAKLELEERPQSALKFASLYYSILDLMAGEYLDASEEKGDQLQNEMLGYLHRNYARQISLEELAEHCNISTSYVSKYLRQKVGKSFFEYLTSVRLRYAKYALEHSNENISRICFDCGFSSLSLFNRSFRKEYGVTPSEYRKGLAEEIQAGESPMTAGPGERQQFAELIEAAGRRQHLSFAVDARGGERYRKNWNETLNFGHAHELLTSEVQEHIKRLKRRLGFRYLRVSGLFTPNMNIDIRSEQGYNFSKVNQLLDFLVENDLIPFLDLGFAPWEIFFGPRKSFYQEVSLRDYTAERYGNLAEAFLQNCLNRYGRQTMERWRLEFFLSWEFEHRSVGLYFPFFEELYHAAKAVSSRLEVGGGSVYTYDTGLFEDLVRQWSGRKVQPDFISAYVYPYRVIRSTPEAEEREDHFRRTGQAFEPDQSDDYLRDKLRELRNILVRYGYSGERLRIVGWGYSVSCRNHLNDAGYLGAYTVRSMIECIGGAEEIVRTGATDLVYTSYYPTEELFGGIGLISAGGILKPVYYAMEFLNRLGDTLLCRDEGAAVTRDEAGNYRILVSNKAYLTADYYAAWDETDVRQLRSYTEGVQREYTFTLTGVEPGEYRVRVQTIGDGSGAPLEEWGKLGYEEKLDRQELEYLAAICRPRLTNGMQKSEGTSLALRTTLEPNDIQYIEVTRKQTREQRNRWF